MAHLPQGPAHPYTIKYDKNLKKTVIEWSEQKVSLKEPEATVARKEAGGSAAQISHHVEHEEWVGSCLLGLL